MGDEMACVSCHVSSWTSKAGTRAIQSSSLYQKTRPSLKSICSNWDGATLADKWPQYKAANGRHRHIKKLVRNEVPFCVRAKLWQEVSGGRDLMNRMPSVFGDTCLELFGADTTNFDGLDLPFFEHCSPRPREVSAYFLTKEGITALRKVLHALLYHHPDISCCPLLEPVAAVLLHFMDDQWCFACLSAMLMSSGKKYYDQTVVQHTVSTHTFHFVLKKKMESVHKRLKSCFIDAPAKEDPVLFETWNVFLFYNLEFSSLVRVVDCFMVEGPKVIYRISLLMLKLFSQTIRSSSLPVYKNSEELRNALAAFVQLATFKRIDLIKEASKIQLKWSFIEKFQKTSMGLYLEGKLTELTDQCHLDTPFIFTTYPVGILDKDEWILLISWLPERIQLLSPNLVFSTDIDGYNLKTLYKKAEEEEQTIIVVRTEAGEVFGAYLSHPLSDRRRVPRALNFFGTGETFVFSFKPTIACYYWVGKQHQDEQLHKHPYSVTSIDHTHSVFRHIPSGLRISESLRRQEAAMPRSSFHRTSNHHRHSINSRSCRRSVHLSCADTNSPCHDSPSETAKDLAAKQGTVDWEIGDDKSLHSEFKDPVRDDMFIAADDTCLIVGGGEGYSIWLDENLMNGRSDFSTTFHNYPLTNHSNGDFVCSQVEVFSLH